MRGLLQQLVRMSAYVKMESSESAVRSPDPRPTSMAGFRLPERVSRLLFSQLIGWAITVTKPATDPSERPNAHRNGEGGRHRSIHRRLEDPGMDLTSANAYSDSYA